MRHLTYGIGRVVLLGLMLSGLLFVSVGIVESACTPQSNGYCQGSLECTDYPGQQCVANCCKAQSTPPPAGTPPPGGGGTPPPGGGGASCSDYITNIANPVLTKLSSTAVNVAWQDISGNPFIDRQNLSVCPWPSGACVFNQNIPLGTHQQDVLGLTEGRYYRATIRAYAGNAPGLYALCSTTGIEEYMSSCLLTPNPGQTNVGGTAQVLTTQISTEWLYRVLYSRTNGTGQISISPSSDLFSPYRTSATGVADGNATVTNTVQRPGPGGTYITMCTDSATVNVGAVPPPPVSNEAWWQVVGGGIYAGSEAGGITVQSKVPTGQYLQIPGAVGSVGALLRASGSYDTGLGSLSTTAWKALTKYRGKRMDYNYFAAQMGVLSTQANDFVSDVMGKPVYNANKDFYYINPIGTASLSSTWNVLNGEKYIVFVDGNLTINQNVTVANGGYLMFIVRGDLNVATNVTSMEGIYVVGGTITTDTVGGGGDTQLIVSGSVVAWDGISLNRDLGPAGNSAPAEKFVYRPDLLISMPSSVKSFAMQWQEVAPGSF